MGGDNESRGVRVIGAIATLTVGIMAFVWAVGFIKPEPAQAIPMFAIRTGSSCDLCHSTFPGMTNYGMMVMMSNFAMLPHDAAHSPGITSLVFAEEFDSDPDTGVPKLHTDNLGFLSGGFVGKDFTYYLEQHVIDGGFVGGTDQFWMAYNNLFGGTGALQFGKFHTPFPFMPAHRITLAPYETTSNTVGENDFNEDDSHWGVTMSQMQGTLMYGLSALGGNDLIGKGAFALAGDHNHSVDFSLMTMSDQPLNVGFGLIRGFAPLSKGGFDPFNREAVYLQYQPSGIKGLQFQVVGQLGYDENPSETGVAERTRGGFIEAQYELPHKNFVIARWDTQNGGAPQAGATLDFIHQIAPNMKLTIEGRKLTTGTTMGMALEWAGPWTRSRIIATPHLGSMAGMNMGSMKGMSGMQMAGMNMAGGGGMSQLDHTLAHGDAQRGAQDFTLHSCIQCHGAGGAGGGIGPRLIGVATSLSPEQIYDYIKNPRVPMPDFKLSDDEIADLVAYVNSLTRGHTVVADLNKEHPGMAMSGMSMAVAPPPRSPDQAPVNLGAHGYFAGVESGDPAHGATLFSTNCASCHGVGGAGGDSPRLIGLAKVDSPSFFAWQIKDPPPPMPRLTLSDKQIADLAAYLETIDANVNQPGAPLQSRP
jgi:mono/diheme cytochrome c family protein